MRKSAGSKALLTLVESHVPSSDRHDPLAEFLTEVSSPAVVSSAVVYERTGFGAAAVRGIITALSLQRRGVEHALFNSIEEAAASLLPHLAADARRPATAHDVVKLLLCRRARRRARLGAPEEVIAAPPTPPEAKHRREVVFMPQPARKFHGEQRP